MNAAGCGVRCAMPLIPETAPWSPERALAVLEQFAPALATAGACIVLAAIWIALVVVWVEERIDS